MLPHLMQLQRTTELVTYTHFSNLINKLSNIKILGCKTWVLLNVFENTLANFGNDTWQFENKL